ncbi:cyclic nucleotide-binding-like protein [Pavlovales sp. CCMP2436]|nr:cyclic nucleotide-binding-like protein [Pavlovales sp. CCMP2436]|mmetsp:Transcript_19858/g.46875  ORF Transcript_19858/g.46875 Transcript_19858/m.46875 type:complete len:331 (+) Transcript_19858:136-1128(+)
MGCTGSVAKSGLASAAPKNFKPRRRNSVSAEVDMHPTKAYAKKVFPKSREERAFLKSAVAGIFLFSDLHSSLLDEVIDAMEKKHIAAGQRVIAQGDTADFFYVVESGTYRVIKDGKVLSKEYSGSGYFGEIALMYQSPRTATVEASLGGVVWALDRQVFRHTVTTAKAARVAVSQESLSKVKILSTVTIAERARLGDALVACEFNDGDTIIKQGAYGDNLFIVEEGLAIAYIDIAKGDAGGSFKKKEVFRHTAGDYFGERALLTDEPRAATVIASGPLKAWTVDRASFERLLGTEVKRRMSQRVSSYDMLEGDGAAPATVKKGEWSFLSW